MYMQRILKFNVYYRYIDNAVFQIITGNMVYTQNTLQSIDNVVRTSSYIIPIQYMELVWLSET